MPSIPDIQKKRGRGRPPTGTDPMWTFRAPPELAAAVERAARSEGDNPSRSEMIRRIVTGWLRERGHLRDGDDGLRPDQLNAENDG